jgi:hypothetical protein
MPIKTDEYTAISDSQGDLNSRWRKSKKTKFRRLTCGADAGAAKTSTKGKKA